MRLAQRLKYVCQNKVKYFNQRSGKFELADCGKCLACFQRKNAKQLSTLLQQVDRYKHIFFLTLSYSDEFLPTCEVRFDFDKIFALPTCKRISEKYGSNYLPFNIDNNDKNARTVDSFLRKVNHYKSNRETCKTFGILFYPDVQRFFKRLRQQFYRDNLEKLDVKYFVLCEYGAKYLRPHYHILLFSNDERLSDCLFKRYDLADSRYNKYRLSFWQYGFCDCQRLQSSEAVMSYVSSYVSSPTCFNSLYERKELQQSFKKSAGLCHAQFMHYKTNRVDYLSLSLDALKSLQVEQCDEFIPLFDSEAVVYTLFPKCPIFLPRNTSELHQFIKHFRSANRQGRTTKEFISDSLICNDFIKRVYDYLRSTYEENNRDCTFDELQRYLMSCFYRLCKFADHYEPMISGDYVKDYSFIKKLNDIWDYFAVRQNWRYFADLELLKYPCFCLSSLNEDYYSKASLQNNINKYYKNKKKKLHNDKNHKSQ